MVDRIWDQWCDGIYKTLPVDIRGECDAELVDSICGTFVQDEFAEFSKGDKRDAELGMNDGVWRARRALKGDASVKLVSGREETSTCLLHILTAAQ